MVQEQIPHLEIPMDDIPCVHVFDGSAKLDCVSPYLWEAQTSPLLHHIHDRPIRAEFEDNKSTFLEGEGAMELYDVWMLHFRMDL